MKVFIFNQYNKKRNRRSGTLTIDVKVYEVKSTKLPHLIGDFTYSTGSTRGAESEVMNFLFLNGHLKEVNEIKDRYYSDSIGNFRIREV